jgi:hypothetical protein
MGWHLPIFSCGKTGNHSKMLKKLVIVKFCKICNKETTTADRKLQIADKTYLMVWMYERISMTEIVEHEPCAQAHHGHQEGLGHGAHQGLHQGAE